MRAPRPVGHLRAVVDVPVREAETSRRLSRGVDVTDTAALQPGATVVISSYEGRLPVSGTVLELDDIRVRVQRNDGWADWYDVSEVQVIDRD